MAVMSDREGVYLVTVPIGFRTRLDVYMDASQGLGQHWEMV